MTRPRAHVLAAVDIGTNAVRLEIARALPDGSIETLHQERDPIRPGEGVFTTGSIPRSVAERLVSTLRRYAALCRRHGANVRAVATSAVREARNREAILERVRRETGLPLEVVSGQEEARLICIGVLAGRPEWTRSLVIDIGGGSTEVAVGQGERPRDLYSVALGAVRLTEIFAASGRVGPEQLEPMRAYASEAFRERLPTRLRAPRHALGSSGTIGAVVSFASRSHRLDRKDLERAVRQLAEMSPAERRRRFDPRRAEIIVAGAVILEAAMRHLGIKSLTAVDTGLRNGVLVDLARRAAATLATAETREAAALGFGRRFAFDERHGRHVAHLALQLFDQLAPVHGLAAADRQILAAGALLHDVGHAVSPHRHHKHTLYLLQNADLAGFSDDERARVSLVARYHRRSYPERDRPDLEPLGAGELRALRRMVALLRVADALDRSHRQVVAGIGASASRGTIRLVARLRAPADLELWDVEREAAWFARVMGCRLEISTRRAR